MMSRKPIVFLVLIATLLMLALLLMAARGVDEPARQSGGMDMATATTMPGDGMSQPTQQPHIVPLPAEYASLTNTVPADSASLSRGAALYQANCSTCHGPSGLGDGGMAASLNPAAPAIAWTSQMMTDTYLFYRISEGGTAAPFSSAMPAWKSTLRETDRWDLVNYIRSLAGSAGVQGNPSGGCPMMGGSTITATTGMSGMGTMNGMGGMGAGCMMNSGTMTNTTGMGSGGMGTMSGMGAMGSGSGCPMMTGSTMTNTAMIGSGMGGMNGGGMAMSGMGGSGMTMAGNNMAGMTMTSASIPAEVVDPPWYANPWTLLGWVLLGLLILGLIGAFVVGAIFLLRRSRPNEPVHTPN